MQAINSEIRDAQQASWNKFSPGWRKWDLLAMSFLQSHGTAIIEQTELKADDQVLDIASGTGEPGISIAKAARDGHVTMTDLAEGMLEVAKEKASVQGLSNVSFAAADACALPFEDATFDVVTCRLGFMFFPDMQIAAQEMSRVLKPGGRLAITVWGPPENNFWVTCIVKNIKAHLEFATPPPGAPGMFRCAAPGLMVDLFQQAGLTHVTERFVDDKINCANAEEYWDFMTEIAAPFVSALSKADDETVARIRQGVIDDLNARFPGGTGIDTRGIVISGSKA